jgi:hypothetical protein
LPGKEKHTLGRFCTTFLKIAPAFEFWYKYLSPEKIGVNIGFRYDEQERIKTFTTTWDFPISCNLYGNNRQNWIKGLEWRYGIFKLIEDKIIHPQIIDYFRDKNIHFPKDSNCQNCIFKNIEQISMNNQNCPNQIEWANNMEILTSHKWHKNFSINQSKIHPIQKDFIYGDQLGCDAGECLN